MYMLILFAACLTFQDIHTLKDMEHEKCTDAIMFHGAVLM
jgi:hypothetical protein